MSLCFFLRPVKDSTEPVEIKTIGGHFLPEKKRKWDYQQYIDIWLKERDEVKATDEISFFRQKQLELERKILSLRATKGEARIVILREIIAIEKELGGVNSFLDDILEDEMFLMILLQNNN